MGSRFSLSAFLFVLGLFTSALVSCAKSALPPIEVPEQPGINGALDTTFGTEGVVKVSDLLDTGVDLFNGVAFNSSGDLFVCGQSGTDSFVQKYTGLGQLDARFGDQGQVVLSNIGGANGNDICKTIQIDSKDRIVIAGQTDHNDGIAGFAIRLGTDGVPDTTFDSDGLILFTTPLSDGPLDQTIESLTIGSQDGIYLAGDAREADTRKDGFVIKLNEDGTSDSFFNAGNPFFIKDVTNAPAFDEVGKIVVDKQGAIFVSGYNWAIQLFGFIVKIEKSGIYDEDFASNGVHLFDENQIPNALHTLDNRLFVGGHDGFNRNPLITQLNATDGTLIEAFGQDGRVLLNDPTGRGDVDDFVYSIVQYENSFYAIGGSVDGFIIKFDPLGQIDTTFGNQGALTNDTGNDNYWLAGAMNGSGRLAVVGYDKGATIDTYLTVYQ